MTCCYELESGCCGASVRSTVCIGLWNYIIFGLSIVCFVFTNKCYPPFYYPDYILGGCGAALALISFVTACVVDLKKCQCLRAFMAFLTILTVLATVGSCYYYTIMRWHDVVITIIIYSLRPPDVKDFPDYFWRAAVIIGCICGSFMIIYIVYITSFMCNKWKSHLFTSPYMNNVTFSALPPTLSVPRETYSTRTYKPYPVQRE